MKNKIGLGLALGWILFVIIMVYAVGGKISPYLWNGSVFIIAPAACLLFFILLVLLLIRCIRKKKLGYLPAFLIVTAILAYPVTVLMGYSVLTYPTHQSGPVVEAQNPVEGSVLFGGKEYKSHAVWPSECYAFDILKEPYNIGSNDLESYGIYLADVVSPVTGTVIGVKNDEDDIPPNTEEFISGPGNYIYMRIDETGTYLILAHLEKNSITVSVGDHVEAGELLAKVGNSGTTSEPHLHIQHQRNNPLEQRFAVCAEGLPLVIEYPKYL